MPATILLFAVLPTLIVAAQPPPELVLSGDALPSGAIARFGIPHKPFPNPYYPFAAGYSDEGSFRVAVADGKDVRVWTWHGPTAQPPKHLFEGLPAEATRLALSPDGRTLAAGDKGGDIRVWDLASGTEILALEDEPTTGALVVGPRGRLVFRAGKTGFALWDTVTRKRLALGDDSRSFVAAAFSPDGKQIVTADKNGKLDLWEARTAKRVGELAWAAKPPPKDRGPFGLKLGAGGKPVMPLPGGDGLLHVVNPSSPEHDGGVIRIAFSADGTRVVVGGATVVRAWEVESRNELWMSSHSSYFTNVGSATAWTYDSAKLSGMDISADGRFVATADVSGTVRVKDATTGMDRWIQPRLGNYHQHALLGVAFHPNGKWLATHAAGDCVDLWDVRTGVHLATTGGHTGAVLGLAFSPDGAYLASFGEDHFLDLYDVKARRPVNRAFTLVGTGNGFGFTANGRYIVTGPASHGQFAAVELLRGPRPGLRVEKPESWYGGAPVLCIDPRAPARIVSAGGQQVIFGEDIPTKKHFTYGDGTAATYIRLNDTPNQIALAAEANRLVVGSGSYQKQALVYDLKTGKQPIKLEGDGPAYGVAVTPDGKLIAAATRIANGGPGTRQLRVWDGDTGKLKFKIDFGEGHGSPPTFSPDGKQIAIGVGGEIVCVSIATGKEVARMKGHRGNAWRIVYSPDGKHFASCADDGQTLLWNLNAFRGSKP